jgi:ADP-heptose:LPS heptosyltransferase
MIDEPLVQVGITGEKQLVPDFRKDLSLAELKELIKNCHIWISVDSFFQHMGWDQKKPGIVLWGPSDPLIFGHPENKNLLKDRKYLTENQFLWWEGVDYSIDRFVKPEVVMEALKGFDFIDES